MSIPMDSTDDIPLLGVSGSLGTKEIDFARRFDDLHQLIYRKGGIRPTNAAVEEVAKLVFLRIWWLKRPDAEVRPGLKLQDLFTGLDTGTLVEDFKSAFAAALNERDLAALTPTGSTESLWPSDEPFRVTNVHVLQTAVGIVNDLIGDHSPAVSDPLGTAFDALLSGRYDHSGGLGTYLTPSSVARTMAEIGIDLLGGLDFSTRDGLIVGDPFCGTGRFLVAAAEVLREIGSPAAEAAVSSGIFGADQSHTSAAKARINMMLYGVEHPLVWTTPDSITDPNLENLHGKIQLILTNPPFGEGKYESPEGVNQTAKAIPRLSGKARIDPALAGLVKSLMLLKPGGVLGIVLPDGVIESRAFAELVSGEMGKLSDQVSVVANISLPTATFSLSGTVAKTSAIFLRKEPKTALVSLARVDHVGYIRQAGKAAHDPEGNELPKIPSLIRRGLANAGKATLTVESQNPLVAIVQPNELQSYDPARVDPAALQAKSRITAAGGCELRELLQSKKPRRSRYLADVPFVSVLHIDDLGTVAWHEAGQYTPSTPGILASGGDVIVSLLNPSKLRATVIPEEVELVQVSAEFGVFRPEENPYAILALLYSEDVRMQLRPLGRGTSSSRRRIDQEDVLALQVPLLNSRQMQRINETVSSSLEAIANSRMALSSTFRELRANDASF